MNPDGVVRVVVSLAPLSTTFVEAEPATGPTATVVVAVGVAFISSIWFGWLQVTSTAATSPLLAPKHVEL